MVRQWMQKGGVFLLSLILVFLLTGLAVAESKTVKILCLGDSLTEGFGVDPEQAYPFLLEALFKENGSPDVEVVNAGISGSTTASGLSRLNWQLRGKPDILILALGANDGLRGLPLEETRKNLERTISLAKENRLQVILAGMQLPPNYGPDYTKGFEALFSELAKKYEIALIPFLLEGVAGETLLNQADGIHPNAEGHRVIAKTVFRYLEPLL